MKTRIVAAALVICALFAGGCRRRVSHRTVAPPDDDIFTTDDFPGAPVQDGNTADDGRAMSPSGESATGNSDVFYDGRKGAAIVVYFTEGLKAGDPDHLYAHYFDGERWTPPVCLSCPDGRVFAPKAASSPTRVVVAFLNTAADPSESARERDGDALIFWDAKDFDQDGASPADGPNRQIWMTYFDAGAKDDPARNFGFQEVPTRISAEDGADEDTGAIAIVTDGLRGQAGFADGGSRYFQGDPTTGLAVAWIQDENNDSFAPLGLDVTLDYSVFDLAQAGPAEAPLVPGPVTRAPILGFGASDSGVGSEETIVGGTLVVYDEFLFFRVASDATPGAGFLGIDAPAGSIYGVPGGYGNLMEAEDDVTVQWLKFDGATGSVSAPQTLAVITPDSTDTVNVNQDLLGFQTTSIYGPDEGLAHLLVFNVYLPSDPDATTDFGSMTIDGLLLAYSIDLASNSIDSSVVFDAQDPAIFDTVSPGRVRTQLSRNGDFVWVAWIEPDGAGASTDRSLRVSQGVMIRPDADGLAPSPLPALSGQFSATVTLSTDIDGFDVEWFEFQEGISYVCGAQSDPDVMNFFFEHSDASEDVVYHARLTADLLAKPVPTIAVGVFETFEDMDQPAGFAAACPVFAATDAGAGGEALCVFHRDIDPTAESDRRLFARVTGSALTVEIDSADPLREAASAPVTLIGTPAGEEIGTFDPATGEDSGARPHPWTRVHVVFRESNTFEESGNGDALRTRVFLADQLVPGAPSGDLFSPGAGSAFAPPAQLCLPFVDPSANEDAQVLGVSVRGDTAALWFHEMGHFYYQEYDDGTRGDGASGWRETDGVPDPALIDDDDPAEIDPASVQLSFFAPPGCDTLSRAMVLWFKELDAAGGGKRMQVRVRSGN